MKKKLFFRRNSITKSHSPLLSGFVNIGHASNSHNDWRIPIFHKDQYICLLDEEIFSRGCIVKDPNLIKDTTATKQNSLKIDFCLNQFVYDEKLRYVFLTECESLKKEWEKYMSGKCMGIPSNRKPSTKNRLIGNFMSEYRRRFQNFCERFYEEDELFWEFFLNNFRHFFEQYLGDFY